MQIANADLARQKCQNNVNKNNTTKTLRAREENIRLKETDVRKKEEMVETTLRRLRALECFNEKQMEKFIKDDNNSSKTDIRTPKRHNKKPIETYKKANQHNNKTHISFSDVKNLTDRSEKSNITLNKSTNENK